MTTLAQSREVRKADPLLSEARKLARSTTSLHRKVRAMAVERRALLAVAREMAQTLGSLVLAGDAPESCRELVERAKSLGVMERRYLVPSDEEIGEALKELAP